MTEKVAVVTGAVGEIGFEIVQGLCRVLKGIVYFTCRDEKQRLNTVKILNSIGLKPNCHILNVSNKQSVTDFAKFLKERHGGIDLLVNDAAIIHWEHNYYSYEAAKKDMDINNQSLLTIKEVLYPLLRDGAKVGIISNGCVHPTNISKRFINFRNMISGNPSMSEILKAVEMNNFIHTYKQTREVVRIVLSTKIILQTTVNIKCTEC